jgi:NAD(P)-dependent dehydrogenase (short-subunit alcohol dehydrogenase family)
MSRFDGRIILITGAAERAGASIALAFADAGATVYINHLDRAQQAAATVDVAVERGFGDRVHPFEADIADPAAVQAMVDEIVRRAGHIDVLLHNASTFRPRPFLDLTVDDVDLSFGVNLRGPLLLSQAVGRVMLERGEGRILAIIGNSLTEAWPDLLPHIVGKSALARLIEQLAVAFSPVIACNSVAPTQFFRSDDGVNDALRVARGESPVTADTTDIKGIVVRETTLDDVIAVLMFLADAPASVNGVTIPVDGGRLLI